MLERIGNYKVVSELGRGGMGVVLKAYDETLKRHVAIKVLSEELTRDATFTARFIREAQSAAQLSHPNITQIYYIGEDHGRHFFVMEFVEGQSLHQLVRAEGKLSPRRASGYILQAAHGLAAAHDLGVIHRDIKPANLMLGKSGLVKIADFGLAVMPSDMARLTSTGMLMGTPGYISPEQCMGEEADGRTDIYSLGVSFYELLAGTIPFQADSPLALVRQVVDVMPKDVATHNPEVDPDCKAILQKMMAKTRAARWQNCHELVVALEEYLGGPGVISGAARATQRMAGAGVALGAAAAMKTPIATADDGPATEVLAKKSAATRPAATTARVASDEDGPATELLTPGRPASATLRDPGATALAKPGEKQLAGARPQERTLMIAAEVASAEPKPRSRVLLIAAVVWFAVAAIGLAIWRSQNGPETGVAESALAVPPAEPPDPALANGMPDTGVTEGDDGTMTSGIAVMSQSDDTTDPAVPESEHGTSSTILAEATGSGGSGTTESAERASLASTTNAYGATVTTASAERASGANTTSVVAGTTVQTAQHQAGSHPPIDSGRSGPDPGTASLPRPSEDRDSANRASLPRETSRAPVPAVPKIAIIARGERSLGAALQEHLQRALSGPGFELVDVENDADLSDLMFATGGNVTIGEIAPRLGAAGIGVVVVIQVEPLGERMLSYMGREELALSSRAKVNVFNVADRKAMGPGWSEKLEYTKLAANKKAESFADDKGSEIAAAIRDGWAGFRQR